MLNVAYIEEKKIIVAEFDDSKGHTFLNGQTKVFGGSLEEFKLQNPDYQELTNNPE